MQILENKHGRGALLHFPQKRCAHFVRLGVTQHELTELTVSHLRDVEQRPERARREQRIARAPENSRRISKLVRKPAHQRRLADTGLAADERQSTRTLTLDRRQPRSKRRKRISTLEQLARPINC